MTFEKKQTSANSMNFKTPQSKWCVERSNLTYLYYVNFQHIEVIPKIGFKILTLLTINPSLLFSVVELAVQGPCPVTTTTTAAADTTTKA